MAFGELRFMTARAAHSKGNRQLERPLSGVERMMYLGSERTTANGFSCVSLRGPFDEAKLRLALDRLPRRHPLLSARVLRKGDVLTFTTEAVPPIPLRLIADDGSGQTFLEVAAAELVTPLDRTTGPLTRFTLVRHPDGERMDLIMTVDHAIADGTACLYAMRDLLTSDGSLEIEPPPLPPPITQLFPAPVAAAEPSLAVPPDPRAQSTSMFSVSTSDIAITSAKLASEPTRALAQRCRERGVTVHAAVCAAFGESFAAVSEDKTKVIISSPVSYRHRLDPGVRDMVSCNVAFTEVHVDLSPPTSLWEQARAVRQQLLEGTTDQKLFASSFAIEEASQAERDDARFLYRARRLAKSYDISISNLGRRPIPGRYGDLTIEAIHFGAVLPGDIAINLLTLDEAMCITLVTSGLSRAANDAARRMVTSGLSRLSAQPP